MKNQYFGDVNDYFKYGLLRAILDASSLKLLLAWMLTPDDGSSDGRFVEYLRSPERWAGYDRPLFTGLQALMDGGRPRAVQLIEGSALLPDSRFHAAHVPDSDRERRDWFEGLLAATEWGDLVFLDPDNGIEVKSRPYGRRHSNKYVYWREIEALWGSGRSLLIYQHFVREERAGFVRRMLAALREATPGSEVEAFSTARVVFLMALQPEHQPFLAAISHLVESRWPGQIGAWRGSAGPAGD